MTEEHPFCELCAVSVSLSVDELVEVSFTVSQAVRRIAAHAPESMKMWDYLRQLYFSPSLKLPTGEAWDRLVGDIAAADEVIPPGGRVVLQLSLAENYFILLDAFNHVGCHIDVKGEPVKARQDVTVVLAPGGASPAKVEIHPGPLRLAVENRTTGVAMVGLFNPNDAFHHGLQKRPFVTGKRLLSNQTFRDLFRGETLEMNQRLKIASLTVLFTDLKGSTALYDKVGDLVAYDLVREHFRVLTEVVRGEGGAVVKTIGDAVMATFPTAVQGLGAALRMREAMDKLNKERGHPSDSLELKIGLHEGPCLAVTLNERLDYFGQAVNIAARVQGLADSRSICVTRPVLDSAPHLLAGRAVRERRAQLKGVTDEMTVFEIP
jgi:class 3 adenylate cyclase